jgi:hypothetical protein
LSDAAFQQEIARRVGAVHLEALGGRAVARGEAKVVEHRRHIQQLRVWLDAEPPTVQRAEEEHASGMVEKHVLFGAANECCGLADKYGIRYDDAGDGFRRLNNHDRCSLIDSAQSARLQLMSPARLRSSFPRNLTRVAASRPRQHHQMRRAAKTLAVEAANIDLATTSGESGRCRCAMFPANCDTMGPWQTVRAPG